jgi:hypothetical protein
VKYPYVSWDVDPLDPDPPYGMTVGTFVDFETDEGPQRCIVIRIDPDAGTARLTEVAEPSHPGHCGCMGGSDT